MLFARSKSKKVRNNQKVTVMQTMSKPRFSWVHMLAAILVIAALGSYSLVRTFAAYCYFYQVNSTATNSYNGNNLYVHLNRSVSNCYQQWYVAVDYYRAPNQPGGSICAFTEWKNFASKCVGFGATGSSGGWVSYSAYGGHAVTLYTSYIYKGNCDFGSGQVKWYDKYGNYLGLLEANTQTACM